MSNYRRLYVPGGHYFFTLVCKKRMPLFKDPEHVSILGDAFRHIKRNRPFHIDAIVVLHDHLHCLWKLPPDDGDFSSRWREIKKYTTRRLSPDGHSMWQPRFWEHCIRDEEDWRRHLDYIHYNPVKHGLSTSPNEWPYSSFHRAVAKGWYPANWAKASPVVLAMERE